MSCFGCCIRDLSCMPRLISAHLRGLLTELRCEALGALRRAALRVFQLPVLERDLHTQARQLSSRLS